MRKLDPNGFHFATPQSKSRGADAYDKRITPGPRFGENLDALAGDETKLHQAPLKARVLTVTHADHGPHGPGRQSAQAEGSWGESHASWGGECIHANSMIENRSHLQRARRQL
jgi:hypothetical protein